MNSEQSAIQKLKNNFLSLLSGAIAGCTSRTFVAPVERNIILRQINNEKYKNLSIMKAIQIQYKEEGLKGLFKGNGANCIRIAPFQAIEFFCFEQYNRLFNAYLIHSTQLSDFQKTGKYLFCGMFSGMTASTFVYPIDMVKTVLSVQTESHTKYKGITNTMKLIFQEKGILGLYKGWGATMCGIAPYAGIKLSSYQTLRNIIFGHDAKIGNVTNLVLGAIAGCVAVTITYPTDLMRRKMQVMVLTDQKTSLINTVKLILNTEGIKGLYRGLGATYFKVMPSTAIAFAINDRLKTLFNVQRQIN